MIRRRVLTLGAPLIAAAALLFAGSEAFAQRGGGGGHGGGGGGHAGGHPGGGGAWHGGGGAGHGGYYGHGWGGYYGYPGWGIGIGFGYPYYYGGYYYSAPTYYYVPDTISVVPSGPPAAVQPPTQTPNALLDVNVPKENADVWLEGVKMKTPGTERRFQTPSLTPGKEYSYEVRARWIDDNGKQVERTQSVPVHAGERVVVDFNPKPAGR